MVLYIVGPEFRNLHASLAEPFFLVKRHGEYPHDSHMILGAAQHKVAKNNSAELDRFTAGSSIGEPKASTHLEEQDLMPTAKDIRAERQSGKSCVRQWTVLADCRTVTEALEDQVSDA